VKYFIANARNERYKIIVSFPVMPLMNKNEYFLQYYFDLRTSPTDHFWRPATVYVRR